MNKNYDCLFNYIDPVHRYRILEINDFRFLFNGFTIGLKDLKTLSGEIRVLDLLNPYRIKTLDKTSKARAKDAIIKDFSVIKSEKTDIYFIKFTLSEKALNFILRYFRGSDRTFRKYKVEFSKSERSLLWKLKNSKSLKFNHKDWTDEEYEAFENPIQNLPTEWDYKKDEYEERRRLFLLNRKARKYMREFKKLPKVPQEKKPKTEFLKNSIEVKQGGIVFNGLGEIKRVEG